MTKQLMLAMAMAAHGIFLDANPEPKGFKTLPLRAADNLRGRYFAFKQWDLGYRCSLT